MNDMNALNQVSRRPQVNESVDELRMAINDAFSVFSGLQEKLEAVTGPHPPEEHKSREVPYQVPLAMVIAEQTIRIKELMDKIEMTTESLEVGPMGKLLEPPPGGQPAIRGRQNY